MIMKSKSALFVMSLLLPIGVSHQAAAADGPQAGQEIVCAGEGFGASKSFKCADGFNIPIKQTAKYPTADGGVILRLMAKVENSVCKGENEYFSGTQGRTVSCMRVPYPDANYLMTRSLEDCAKVGHGLSFDRWKSLSEAGWKATVSFSCTPLASTTDN